ncbi:hypothetical protein GQ43DRAFT_459256 [Delitschia confertaspora ATCC 74209]|uniref:Beta-glucuronidase C-terminal domain-containing protein n=1 Tax=Delitschia confertaspora ATCC 74209 TaxID=1513339 RepID=A0A9P4JB51_9PLEO|nr:hypothetical protein GQ43DRAFT_459256 [Delitschia confertaspora ATCC 74209]
MFHSLCLAACLSFASLSLAQYTISIAVVQKPAPSALSAPLDASFAGFGIEPSNLFSFTGEAEPNQLSVTLLQNLADYSGAPPHIRLGGNTGDYMIWKPSFTDYRIDHNEKSVGQGAFASDSMIFGPGYFKALDRFPKDTPVTFGLNLAYQESDYIDNIVKEAQAAVDNMKKVKLYSFEIGNEPDLYLQNGFRSGVWNGDVYIKEFLERAKAVYERVLKPAGLPMDFFETSSTASTIGTTFEIEPLHKAGLTDGDSNGLTYISAWNQHDYFYFIDVTPTPLTLNDLVQLDNTNKQFAYWEKQIKTGLDIGLPYVLREMCSAGPIGVHGITDTFGAALWTLNFFLYAATLNISSVQMHMTDNSFASAWQPINMYDKDPFVRPQYYAHAAMAQIIGNGNGTTQIGLLHAKNTIPESYKGYFRAYGAYSNGNLQSVILINSREANTSVSDKESLIFTLDLGPAHEDKTLFLSHLTAPGTDSQSDTTWNGVVFLPKSGKPSAVPNFRPQTLRTSSSGQVTIPVRDSQAVVVNIGWLLGSHAVVKPDGGKPQHTPKKSAAGPTRSGPGMAKVTAVATGTAVLVGNILEGQRGRCEG